MKIASVLILGSIFFVITMAGAADEHQTPVAPEEYLNMENPIDADDLDDDLLKKVGKLYKRKCKKCHGSEGDGKGSAAADIEIKPTAFNAPGYFEEKKDGQLFWITLNGSDGTEMKGFGPDSDAGLSEDQLWELVVFIRESFTK